ncbi:hypothetical protein [Paenibacillus tarimensis]|uniref:hypothetical protein n=1 Tax=Paenibacillus tarimensis TaxID=416012 RepID=UPI001F4112EB|nr:hypothetical protein [Paenibacillus tarimensis]MCF2945566.1 hypothetical protein [Paenibacillus tarimensis]
MTKNGEVILVANKKNDNSSFMDQTKNASKEGFDIVHDTIDVIGDATSTAAKKVTNTASNTMDNVTGGKE